MKVTSRDMQIAHEFDLGINKAELGRRWKLSRERVGQIIEKVRGTRTPNTLPKSTMLLANELRKLYGVSFEEISKELGITVSAVQNRIYKPENVSDSSKKDVLLAIDAITQDKLDKHSSILKQLTKGAE